MESIMSLNGSQAKTTQHPLAELQYTISIQIIGQDTLITRVLMALLADGHVLLEGVRLAKTLLVKTVAQAIRAQFARVQFTPAPLLWKGLLCGLRPVFDRATGFGR